MIEGSRKVKITATDIEHIRTVMDTIAEQDITIYKRSEKTERAEKEFRDRGMYDKARLLHYRRSSRVNLYSLDGLDDYFYGYMAPSTGMLKVYDLALYEDGFVITFPDKDSRKAEPLNTSN